ncbi:MAG: aminotransferase class V-fold PLP-dependent enzyme, partial [Nitrospinae bacterium]|nr:aminotransferase class V-fold PLP-dependent enzyme [Nitrospinota bacterium]
MMYFDYAALAGPRPESIYQEVNKNLRWLWGSPGRGSHSFAYEADRIVFNCRTLINDFFNVGDATRIAFTQNCTEALNLAINGTLKSGDEVITTSMEHNSVLRPLKKREKEGTIKLHIVDADTFGFVNPEKLCSLVTNKTAMVIVNHVSNVNGAIQDIEEIGAFLKNFPTLFLVDASQSAGSISINMKEMGIDLLAVPGHKYLMAPVGASFLAFSEKANPEPIILGGTGSFSSDLVQPSILPDKLNSGTLNVPAIAGLKAGLEFLVRKKEISSTKKLKQLFCDGIKKSNRVKLIGFNGNVGKYQSVFSLLAKNEKQEEFAEKLLAE